MTVARELARHSQAVESGGLAYLIGCVTAAPSVVNATAPERLAGELLHVPYRRRTRRPGADKEETPSPIE